ncbi:MAG: O-antigen ligase family protein [Chloroflexi bacterium]|nr:O-antigen ligase family protein [Chloroflexota bacterium]
MAIQRPQANPYANLGDLALLWGIRAGLLVLLATPLIVTPSTIFPFIVGKALFARTVIEIVLALWLILLIRRPEYRPVASTLAVLFGLFLLGALISGLFGVSPQRSLWSNYERMTGVFDLAHWFAALMIMMTVVKGALQWRIYLSALLGMTIIIGFLGILEANQATWSLFTWLRGLPVTRLEISLGNATYVGAFGMVTTLIAFGLFADLFWRPKSPAEPAAQEPRRGSRRRRRAALAYGAQPDLSITRLALAALYLGAAAAGAFMMFGSGSRGAFFGFGLGLGLAGVAYAIWGTERWIRLTSRAGIVLLIVLIVLFLSLRGSALEGLSGIAPIFDRTVGESLPGRERDRSATSRKIGTQAAVEAFADRPIVGWGYENFATVWNRNVDSGDFTGPFPEFDLAHNKPAEILATTGILGFLPYAGFWLWVLWVGIRKVRAKTETQMIDLFVTAGILAFLGHLLFLFDTTSTFLLLIIMMAFATSG